MNGSHFYGWGQGTSRPVLSSVEEPALSYSKGRREAVRDGEPSKEYWAVYQFGVMARKLQFLELTRPSKIFQKLQFFDWFGLAYRLSLKLKMKSA
jgi:hypothetical protein